MNTSARSVDAELFPGFSARRVRVSGAEIQFVTGGQGPPLLMLHGYPQTHAMWHAIAPRLAERWTVVCADLRGYGDSSKPPGGDRHERYSKREMARDQAELMDALGFERFDVVGHDRGARVAHRLARDHRQRVKKLVVLDISPTAVMFARTDQSFATAYYHWFFLAQPYDLPERLIGADPVYYLRKKITGWSKSLAHFDARALAEYERCFSDPATIHASCEDYRAAADIDLEHDRDDAHEKLACPLLALWGARGVVGRLFEPLADWRSVADDVRGFALDCGHFLAEEKPDQTLAAIVEFLSE